LSFFVRCQTNWENCRKKSGRSTVSRNCTIIIA